MTLDVIELIKKQLSEINFNGYICIAGHGEPTLNPNIYSILNELKKFNLILVTNGLVDVDWNKISNYAKIKISLHDDKNLNFIQSKLKNIDYDLRDHTVGSQELFKNNRAGFFNEIDENLRTRKCYYPFYEVFIDTDGYYRLCASQWEKSFEYSIFDVSIKNHFLENLENIKQTMYNANRSVIPECKLCNTQGIIIGENIYNFWKQFKSEQGTCFQDHKACICCNHCSTDIKQNDRIFY